MDASAVDRMLASYNQCKARAAHLKTHITVMEQRMQNAAANAMLGEALHAQNYDPMPHGNMPGDPVGTLVQRYVDGFIPDSLDELKKELNKAKRDLENAEAIIAFVDGWMLALTDREKYVIIHQVICKETWCEVLNGYEMQFGPYGKQGLRRMRKRALEKIYETVE